MEDDQSNLDDIASSEFKSVKDKSPTFFDEFSQSMTESDFISYENINRPNTNTNNFLKYNKRKKIIEKNSIIKNIVQNNNTFKKYPITSGPNERNDLPAEGSNKLECNILSFVKNIIGKDLSRITIPIIVNEPLSNLQKCSEKFEYKDCLKQAAITKDPCLRLGYCIAFQLIQLCQTSERIKKPFNSLLGETFDMKLDNDTYLLAEQVSHHPPISFIYVKGKNYTYRSK